MPDPRLENPNAYKAFACVECKGTTEYRSFLGLTRTQHNRELSAVLHTQASMTNAS